MTSEGGLPPPPGTVDDSEMADAVGSEDLMATFFRKRMTLHGDIFRTRLYGIEINYLCHQRYLTEFVQLISKGDLTRYATIPGLMAVHGEDVSTRREPGILQCFRSMFHGRLANNVVRNTQILLKDSVDKWAAEDQVLGPQTMRTGFALSFQLVFGWDTADFNSDLLDLFHCIVTCGYRDPHRVNTPGTQFSRAIVAAEEVHAVIRKHMRERTRESPRGCCSDSEVEADDVLEDVGCGLISLLARSPEMNSFESDEDLPKYLFRLIANLTGVYAHLFGVLLQCLGQHPAWAEHIRSEVIQHCGSRKALVLTREKIDLLIPLRAFVIEAVRMYPYCERWFYHVLRREVEFDGRYTFRAGSAVMFSHYAAHMSPEVWDDPIAFRPDRHYDRLRRLRQSTRKRKECPGPAYGPYETMDDEERRCARELWLAGGYGPWRCSLVDEGLLVGEIFVATIVSDYEVQITETFRQGPNPGYDMFVGKFRLSRRR